MDIKTFFAEFEFLQIQQKAHYKLTYAVDPKDSVLVVSIHADPDYPEPWAKPISVKYWCPGVTGTLIWPADPDNKELCRHAATGIPRYEEPRIPRTIYQAWLQATEDGNGMQIPAGMHTPINSWRTLNPEYNYKLYNDRMIREFLEREFPPSYLQAYDLLLPKAYKVDFWRYAVLYKYGGIYADSKMTLLVPLRQLVRPHDKVILAVADNQNIAIAFMGFEPGHPILKNILERIVDMVGRRDKGPHPLALTGPLLAVDAMRRHFGFQGPVPLGCGPDWITYSFGHLGEKDRQYFYDAEGRPIIKYLYDGYKQVDNQEWKHYPALWWGNVVFRDQVPPHVAEIPDMQTMPEWLMVKKEP